MRNSITLRCLFWAGFAAALFACGCAKKSSVGPQRDAGHHDVGPLPDRADQPDSAPVDAAVDSAVVDAASADGAAGDGGGQDGAVADGGGQDAAGTDAWWPDASGNCSAVVDLFPTPVSETTSPFPSIDDDYLLVTFTMGFTFTFYGTQYSDVYLNTNGGMTFTAGNSSYDEASYDVTVPGIAIFWGDMDAAEYGADTRANQMVYQQCDDRFIITYVQFQDNDDGAWNNTANVILHPNGTIEIQYGAVLSQDILVGVFDGTHTSDQFVSVQPTYANYPSMGTGVILFDDFGSGPTHTGQLSSQTITFQAP